MVAHAREDVQSVHFPLGVMNVKLFVISAYGEDFVETVTACDYCGAEIIPNGNTETVRDYEPGSHIASRAQSGAARKPPR